MHGPDDTLSALIVTRERIAVLSAAVLRTSASLDLATVLGEAVDTARGLNARRRQWATSSSTQRAMQARGRRSTVLLTGAPCARRPWRTVRSPV